MERCNVCIIDHAEVINIIKIDSIQTAEQAILIVNHQCHTAIYLEVLHMTEAHQIVNHHQIAEIIANHHQTADHTAGMKAIQIQTVDQIADQGVIQIQRECLIANQRAVQTVINHQSAENAGNTDKYS